MLLTFLEVQEDRWKRRGILGSDRLRRCLMGLRDASPEAKKLYRRFAVFASKFYYKSLKLSIVEIKFVEQVLTRLKSFLGPHHLRTY